MGEAAGAELGRRRRRNLDQSFFGYKKLNVDRTHKPIRCYAVVANAAEQDSRHLDGLLAGQYLAAVFGDSSYCSAVSHQFESS